MTSLLKVIRNPTKFTITPKDVHSSIRCDECGVCPIKGIRYKSKKVFNFDICEDCRKDNHDETNCKDFVFFNNAVPTSEANLFGPRRNNVIHEQTASDAELQLARKGTATNMAYFFPFYNSDLDQQMECMALVDFINAHAFTSIHILFPNSEQVLECLATGLSGNTSIKFLDLQFASHSFAVLSRVDCFHKLIEGENAIETLVISTTQASRLYRDYFIGLMDHFAESIFESLKQARTIKTFRLDFHSPLSQERKEQAWKTVQSNRRLTRFHADFEIPDHHLAMLTSFNRYQWVRRWVDVSSTLNDRLLIVEEIRKCNLQEEAAAWALFQLLRIQPDALLL
jgi:hypothetical protein